MDNLNAVPAGPEAKLVSVAAPPPATYDSSALPRVAGNAYDPSPVANVSSIHLATNGVFSGAANDGDGGTALKISGTGFFAGDFTLEFGFRTDGRIDVSSMYSRPNLVFCQTGSPYFQMTFDTSGRLLLVYYNVNSGTSTYTGQTIGDAHAYDDGAWHRIAVVHDREGKTVAVHVDGSRILNVADTLLDTSVAGDMYVGGSANKGIRFLNGWLDNFRFTRRAMDPKEFLVEWGEASDVVRQDTLAYLPLDGSDATSPAIGDNLNAVPGGPVALPVVKGEVDAALWDTSDAPGTFVRDGLGGAYEANAASLHLTTNASNKGTAVRLAETNYFDGGSFTAEMFFKTSGRIEDTAVAAPCLMFSGATPYLQVTFNKADGRLYLAYSNAGAWAGGAFGEAHAYDDGTWHHLAVVYDCDAKTISAFVDREEVTRHENATVGPYDPIDLVLGARGLSSAYTRFFDGAIDSFRFSRAALGPDDFLRRWSGVRGLRMSLK